MIKVENNVTWCTNCLTSGKVARITFSTSGINMTQVRLCKNCARALVREIGGKCGNCQHFIGIDGKNFRVCELKSGLGMTVEATDYCSRWEGTDENNSKS